MSINYRQDLTTPILHHEAGISSLQLWPPIPAASNIAAQPHLCVPSSYHCTVQIRNISSSQNILLGSILYIMLLSW